MRYEAQRMASNSVGNWLVVVWVGRGWLRLTRHLGPFCPFFTVEGQRAPAGAGFISNSAGRFGEVWRTWCEGERGEGDEKSAEEKSKLR